MKLLAGQKKSGKERYGGYRGFPGGLLGRLPGFGTAVKACWQRRQRSVFDVALSGTGNFRRQRGQTTVDGMEAFLPHPILTSSRFPGKMPAAPQRSGGKDAQRSAV
jgi:hypothetical protein